MSDSRRTWMGFTLPEITIVSCLLLMVVLGPTVHSWFEWRITRDVVTSQSMVEQRLASVEQFVESRKDTAPADVLAETKSMHEDVMVWLTTHSMMCETCVVCKVCEVCKACVPEQVPRSDDPVDDGS